MFIISMVVLISSSYATNKVAVIPSQIETIILTQDNTAYLNQPFNAQSVAEVQDKLSQLAANTTDDLYLVLYTPGGSISAGNSLIDFVNSLDNKVHTITLFAASMGYITAQSLGKRYIVPSGILMSHRASVSGVSGQIPGEALSRLKHISSMVEELSKKVANRVNMSYDDYMKLIYDEAWLTAKEAVAGNHADKIVNVKCDRSLNGTYNKNVRTIFGNVNVEFSNCPLIRSPITVNSESPLINKEVIELFEYETQDDFKLTL